MKRAASPSLLVPTKSLKTEDPLETMFENADFNSWDLTSIDALAQQCTPNLPNLILDESDFVVLDEMNPGPSTSHQPDISVKKKPAAPVKAPLKDVTIAEEELGFSVYLKAVLFKNHIKVHIREFTSDASRFLTGTKRGVCVDLPSWYEFGEKLLNFSVLYQQTSFVVKNTLLVSSDEGDMHLKRLDSPSNIKLNEDQVLLLKQCYRNFNERVLAFMIEKYVPQYVTTQCKPTLTKDYVNLRNNFLACIRNELENSVFNSLFICSGCWDNLNNQLGHTCLMTPSADKFKQLGVFSLLAIDWSRVAQNFVDDVPVVSTTFLKSLNTQSLIEGLYENEQ